MSKKKKKEPYKMAELIIKAVTAVAALIISIAKLIEALK